MRNDPPRYVPAARREISSIVIGVLCFGAAALSAAPASAQEAAKDETEIRRAILQASIASFGGNCPCPESRAANGSRCGQRSAYSRPGGASVKCYPTDVTADEIERYRAKRN
jgi:hypothetical protein